MVRPDAVRLFRPPQDRRADLPDRGGAPPVDRAPAARLLPLDRPSAPAVSVGIYSVRCGTQADLEWLSAQPADRDRSLLRRDLAAAVGNATLGPGLDLLDRPGVRAPVRRLRPV